MAELGIPISPASPAQTLAGEDSCDFETLGEEEEEEENHRVVFCEITRMTQTHSYLTFKAQLFFSL